MEFDINAFISVENGNETGIIVLYIRWLLPTGSEGLYTEGVIRFTQTEWMTLKRVKNELLNAIGEFLYLNQRLNYLIYCLSSSVNVTIGPQICVIEFPNRRYEVSLTFLISILGKLDDTDVSRKFQGIFDYMEMRDEEEPLDIEESYSRIMEALDFLTDIDYDDIQNACAHIFQTFRGDQPLVYSSVFVALQEICSSFIFMRRGIVPGLYPFLFDTHFETTKRVVTGRSMIEMFRFLPLVDNVVGVQDRYMRDRIECMRRAFEWCLESNLSLQYEGFDAAAVFNVNLVDFSIYFSFDDWDLIVDRCMERGGEYQRLGEFMRIRIVEMGRLQRELNAPMGVQNTNFGLSRTIANLIQRQIENGDENAWGYAFLMTALRYQCENNDRMNHPFTKPEMDEIENACRSLIASGIEDDTIDLRWKTANVTSWCERYKNRHPHLV